MIAALIAATLPAPPEWLISAVVVCLLLICVFGWLMNDGMRARWGGAVAATLAALFMLLCWNAIAHAGTRTLHFTLPTTTALASDGRVIACGGGSPIRNLSGWRLYAQVQSHTWVANRVRMEADPAEYARLWPTCAAEAMPRQVRSASSKHLPNGGAGQLVTVDAPDSLDGMPVLAWYVVSFNDSLRVACRSNWRIGR